MRADNSLERFDAIDLHSNPAVRLLKSRHRITPNMMQITIDLPDLDATQHLAEQISRHIETPMTIALHGTLGAGKTQWARFFCEALGVSPESVTSPTYVLLQFYRGSSIDVYHLDYYRLDHASQAWDLGVDEFQTQPVVLLIEWADRFPETLADDRIDIRLEQPHDLSVAPGTGRRAILMATGPRSSRIVSRLSENR